MLIELIEHDDEHGDDHDDEGWRGKQTACQRSPFPSLTRQRATTLPWLQLYQHVCTWTTVAGTQLQPLEQSLTPLLLFFSRNGKQCIWNLNREKLLYCCPDSERRPRLPTGCNWQWDRQHWHIKIFCIFTKCIFPKCISQLYFPKLYFSKLYL